MGDSTSGMNPGMKLEVLESGLRFPEAPRWHGGRLWYSDMYACEVRSVDLAGRSEVHARLSEPTSGLGWLPDGTLLVVSMTDRKLVRVDAGHASVHADLSTLAPHHCNDLVVDARGRAYVGNFGSDISAGGAPTPTCLILVERDGRARVVADELVFPNGMVITADGRTLIVAETFASRLTAFDIAGDGSLSKRRVFASLGSAMPDGICLDAENAVWVASPFSRELLRVREGGEVEERVATEQLPVACALGGGDLRTLFVLTALHFEPEKTVERTGRVEIARVAVSGSA
jgi:sugar lactone lactonase YvrE